MTNAGVSGAVASANAPYDVKASVIGAGGVRMKRSAGWTLHCIGQSAAALQFGVGGLRLAGGLWQAASPIGVPSDRTFACGFDFPAGNAALALR